MNIPPSEALGMTLWQYEATLVEWNRQQQGSDTDPEPASVDEFMLDEQFFADNPHLLN